MKNLILILIFWALTLPFNAQNSEHEIKWYDIDEALELNEEDPRKIMIYVYSDNCGWCRRMSAKTFANPVIAEYINEKYYPVKVNTNISKDVTIGETTFKRIDADPVQKTPSYHEFVALLLQGRMAYPSTAFLDKDLTYMGVRRGYNDPKDFEVFLHYVADNAYETTDSFEEYAEDFEGKVGIE